ncbi:MAG: glycosyltransferase, partial [Gemmatimonadota bacterium]
SRCLESVLALSYPRDRCEVVVVDNGSTDESQEMVRTRFPDVRWLINDVNNYCRANNLGVRQTNGDLIAFVDSDAWLAPNWLRTLVEALDDDPQLAGVTGKTFLGKGPLLYSTGHEALADDYWRDRGLWQNDGPRYDRAAEVPGVARNSAPPNMRPMVSTAGSAAAGCCARAGTPASTNATATSSAPARRTSGGRRDQTPPTATTMRAFIPVSGLR